MNASKLAVIIEEKARHGLLSKIPFLPAAFPGRAEFWAVMAELEENGADIIEIGVPFSDPVADGPVVAAAGQKALANGGGLAYILSGLTERRFSCGLALMGYVNPFIQFRWAEAAAQKPGATVQEIMALSLELLARRMAEAGVHGLIVPDLPLEESGPWRLILKKHGLALLPLVGHNTSLEKMKLYAAEAEGYVYVVSVMGVTGVRAGLPPEAAATLGRAREAFRLPLALGFGLSSPEQLAELPERLRPEAAIFGSALIRHLEKGGRVRDFMAPWN
ncbi:MAG: tryptophan synthase subunit alpha [Candidatus Adiutrix sp.]|jgi:tryptophan synthase alpha chain|nr:tryptophan synthase subunit alpha [Candidatus Adiutrix sp.]